jgi:hypothetical protein
MLYVLASLTSGGKIHLLANVLVDRTPLAALGALSG